MRPYPSYIMLPAMAHAKIAAYTIHQNVVIGGLGHVVYTSLQLILDMNELATHTFPLEVLQKACPWCLCLCLCLCLCWKTE